MRLDRVRAVLTGASGGIGQEIARALIGNGAKVLLVGRSEAALDDCLLGLGRGGETSADKFACDVTRSADRHRLLAAAASWQGGANVLINNAGQSAFGALQDLDGQRVEDVMAVNLLAPMQLSREFIPHLMRHDASAIVNVGSVLGAIGLPAYSVYAASKFGLRGFSEALRRELDGTGIAVQYLAPRATRTRFNTAQVDAMNAQLGNAVDPPARVARELVDLLASGRARRSIGLVERLFITINALLPAVVDSAVRRQRPTMLRGTTLSPLEEPSRSSP
jgi:short-subunit dehydrogenase